MYSLPANKLRFTIHLLITFFFASLLAIKRGYNISPAILVLISLGYIIYHFYKKKTWDLLREDKWLIGSYVFYFLSYLMSVLIHDGEFRELDKPSHLLLFIPVLLLLIRHQITSHVLFWGILFSSAIAGIVAIYDRFVLDAPAAFSPRIFHIQGGDIAMSLGMFSAVIGIYFLCKRQLFCSFLCLIATALGMLGSFLSTARGGWIGIPVIVCVILFIYRQYVPKRFFVFFSLGFFGAIFALSLIPDTKILMRVQQANNEIRHYFQHDNGSTSVGARFDMWKSAVLMAKEKPLLGWGHQGAVEQRKLHGEQKIISSYAAGFGHAHNQYLDDLSKRGLVGLVALLGIFLIPLQFFVRQLHQSSLVHRTLATLGIVHVLSVMFYCLSQGFFSHNSGNVFYFFVVIVLYGALRAQKTQTV